MSALLLVARNRWLRILLYYFGIFGLTLVAEGFATLHLGAVLAIHPLHMALYCRPLRIRFYYSLRFDVLAQPSDGVLVGLSRSGGGRYIF